MTRLINSAGLGIITREEGLRLTSYQDTGGVWTIGYGHTPATMGQKITPQQANDLLASDVAWAEDTVDGATHTVPTSDNQFSAMVSLTFNIGPSAFRRSTVLKKHMAGDPQSAADAFLLWNMDNGAVLTALARRRGEERALYLMDALPLPLPEDPILTAIKTLQSVLSARGYYKGAVDGDFGPLSYAAVRSYMAIIRK